MPRRRDGRLLSDTIYETTAIDEGIFSRFLRIPGRETLPDRPGRLSFFFTIREPPVPDVPVPPYLLWGTNLASGYQIVGGVSGRNAREIFYAAAESMMEHFVEMDAPHRPVEFECADRVCAEVLNDACQRRGVTFRLRKYDLHELQRENPTDYGDSKLYYACGNRNCPGLLHLIADLRKCSRCQHYMYCSKECQVTHWRNGHKTDCPTLRLQVVRELDESGAEELRHQGNRDDYRPGQVSNSRWSLSDNLSTLRGVSETGCCGLNGDEVLLVAKLISRCENVTRVNQTARKDTPLAIFRKYAPAEDTFEEFARAMLEPLTSWKLLQFVVVLDVPGFKGWDKPESPPKSMLVTLRDSLVEADHADKWRGLQHIFVFAGAMGIRISPPPYACAEDSQSRCTHPLCGLLRFDTLTMPGFSGPGFSMIDAEFTRCVSQRKGVHPEGDPMCMCYAAEKQYAIFMLRMGSRDASMSIRTFFEMMEANNYDPETQGFAALAAVMLFLGGAVRRNHISLRAIYLSNILNDLVKDGVVIGLELMSALPGLDVVLATQTLFEARMRSYCDDTPVTRTEGGPSIDATCEQLDGAIKSVQALRKDGRNDEAVRACSTALQDSDVAHAMAPGVRKRHAYLLLWRADSTLNLADGLQASSHRRVDYARRALEDAKWATTQVGDLKVSHKIEALKRHLIACAVRAERMKRDGEDVLHLRAAEPADRGNDARPHAAQETPADAYGMPTAPHFAAAVAAAGQVSGSSADTGAAAETGDGGGSSSVPTRPKRKGKKKKKKGRKTNRVGTPAEPSTSGVAFSEAPVKAEVGGSSDSDSSDDDATASAAAALPPAPSGRYIHSCTVGDRLQALPWVLNGEGCSTCFEEWTGVLSSNVVVIRQCLHAVCAQCLAKMAKQPREPSLPGSLADQCVYRCKAPLRPDEVSELMHEVAVLAVPHVTSLGPLARRLIRVVKDIDINAVLAEVLSGAGMDPVEAGRQLFEMVTRTASSGGRTSGSNKKPNRDLTPEEKQAVYVNVRAPVEEVERKLRDATRLARRAVSLEASNLAYAEVDRLREEVAQARDAAVVNLCEQMNVGRASVGGETSSGEIVVDLHGLRADEMRVMLLDVVYPLLTPGQVVVCVVGQGRHSRDNKATLREALLNAVAATNRGHISCVLDPRNPGRVRLENKRCEPAR